MYLFGWKFISFVSGKWQLMESRSRPPEQGSKQSNFLRPINPLCTNREKLLLIPRVPSNLRTYDSSRRDRGSPNLIDQIMDYWFYNEALNIVFPLLDGKDLASCLLVCRQWRDIASDDYIWKFICTQKWPSIARKPPSGTTYHHLFATFSKPPLQPPLPLPCLSFNDLVFYIDLWSDETLIFSNAISASVLLVGLKMIPEGISDVLRSHLESTDCKMLLQVEPKITIPQGLIVTSSVLVARTDTDKMACLMHKSMFDYIDLTTSRAMSYDYLNFSPGHPFVSDIRAWVSLLILTKGRIGMDMDMFGLEIDFCDAANSETRFYGFWTCWIGNDTAFYATFFFIISCAYVWMDRKLDSG